MGNCYVNLEGPGIYDKFLVENSDDESPRSIARTFPLSLVLDFKLIGISDFEDNPNELPNLSQKLRLAQEQQNNKNIRELISWKKRGIPFVLAHWNRPQKDKAKPNKALLQREILYIALLATSAVT